MSDLTKWELEPNPYFRRRLAKLGEECSELLLTKERILMQGITAKNPTTGRHVYDEFEDEVADVYAQLDECVEAFKLNKQAIKSRRAHKRSLMQEWEAMYLTPAGTLDKDKL